MKRLQERRVGRFKRSNVLDADARYTSDEFQLLESVPDAIVLVDATGQIVLANSQAARLFNYTRADLEGNSIEMLVPERFRSRHPAYRETFYRNPLARPMGAGLDLFGLRSDGSEFPAEISLSPIPTEDGLLVASAIRDVSERKHQRQMLEEKNFELERANLAKDRFLASMSHELRTPLNAIIGFTGTLLMKLPGPLTEEQEKQLRTVQSSARHLLSLINDILDVAKIESGKVEIERVAFPIQDLVEDVVAALRPLAMQKGLTLGLGVPSAPFVVRGDRRATQQILINLVNNAIKYTERGYVHIDSAQTQRDGEAWIEVSVTDTGIGIDAEAAARLFEAFEQGAPEKTRSEGAGLGLYLCRRLVELLDARLEYASKPGKGSTFSLLLRAEE